MVLPPQHLYNSDPDTTPSTSPNQITQESTQNTPNSDNSIHGQNTTSPSNVARLPSETKEDSSQSDNEYFDSVDMATRNHNRNWSPVLRHIHEQQETSSPEDQQNHTHASFNNNHNPINRNTTPPTITQESETTIQTQNDSSTPSNLPTHAQGTPTGNIATATNNDDQPVTLGMFKQQMMEFYRLLFPNASLTALPGNGTGIIQQDQQHRGTQAEQSNQISTSQPQTQHNSEDEFVDSNEQGNDDQEEDNTPIANVNLFREFRSMPVKKDLMQVPARLMADVDSVTFLSSSLTKIIANINYKEKFGTMKLRNNFNRMYCNASSRYYVQPNMNLPLQYANGNMAQNPIRLSHMPNIRLFPITIGNITYTLSLYVLDSTRQLGNNTTSFLTDKTLLCIVTAFNMVRCEWNEFPSIWKKFYSINDKQKLIQIMQTVQPFFVHKQGATKDKCDIYIDSNTAALILVLFENAMHRLASDDWMGKYNDIKFNGGFTSVKDSIFQTSEELIRKHAQMICKHWLFELAAVGIKYQFPKVQAFLPNLADDKDFVRKHKILCRLATQQFKERINKDKRQNQAILQRGEDIHDLIVTIDVGLELYPVAPGTNFVLNAQEAKQMFTAHLNRKLDDEIEYERSSYILRPDNDDLESEELDSDNEDDHVSSDMDLGEYNQTDDYIFDADPFEDPRFQMKFHPDGTPKDNSIMDSQGIISDMAFQYSFPNCNNSRVVRLSPRTLQRYVPVPTAMDTYLQTLLEVRENDATNQATDGHSEEEAKEEAITDDNNVDDEADDDESVEERINNLLGVREDDTPQEENEGQNDNNNGAETTQTTQSENTTEDNENNKVTLDILSELREITKRTTIFAQFLSNGKIGNVHHEKIVIEPCDILDENLESIITVKLQEEMQQMACHGGNIYMPSTRSMFTKQSTKTQQLQSLFIPHLLKNQLSNIMCDPSQHDYELLQKLIRNLNTRTEELLDQLKRTDRQPVRQEMTFATSDFWKYKFRWPSIQIRNQKQSSHIGIADSRHTYLFVKKVCQDSMGPLMHVTRTPEMPDFNVISPPAKTCLVYMSERILTIFQNFGFNGTISRLFKRQARNASEACPPPDMVVPITQLDRINTELKFGVKPHCLPVYMINPVRLSKAFKKAIQAPTDLYTLDLADNIDTPHDYLWYRQSILSILQQYNPNNDADDSVRGPFLEQTDDSVVADIDTHEYKTGFFDQVDFKHMAGIPQKSLENLFRDVARLIIAAYHYFMLQRLNNKFARQGSEVFTLLQVPKNTLELQQTIANHVDNLWSRDLVHSETLLHQNNPKKCPREDKFPLTSAGKWIQYMLPNNSLYSNNNSICIICIGRRIV